MDILQLAHFLPRVLTAPENIDFKIYSFALFKEITSFSSANMTENKTSFRMNLGREGDNNTA